MSGLVGDSTRSTSAPRSASIIVAKGPGTSVVKSRIFKLDSACMVRRIPLVSYCRINSHTAIKSLLVF